MDSDLQEFRSRREELRQARLGSFLILPLRYGDGGAGKCRAWLEGHARLMPLETTDLTESIKDAVQSGDRPILQRYQIPLALFAEELEAGTDLQRLYTRERGNKETLKEEDAFSVYSVEICSFPQVAFFVLGIRYERIRQLECIVNPGYTESCSEYFFLDSQGQPREFSLDRGILSLCRRAGTDAFFNHGHALFLETYTCSMALVRRRFASLATLRQVSYNLHSMAPLDLEFSDEAEEDVRYVYAVKDVTEQTYRWGCCVSLQSVCMVTADPALDLDGEMAARLSDDLPPILLTLYQKYTCLRFTELLSQTHGKGMGTLRSLHREMLEFKAYGVIYPSQVSRWNNVRQIYAHLFAAQGVADAVGDIDNKITVLVQRQQEKQAAMEGAVGWIITLFGILSIIESVMSFLTMLRGGSPQQHMTLLGVTLGLTAVFGAAVMLQRRRWK